MGGDYTNYRRGAGRDKFEAEKAAGKVSSTASEWARPEDVILMQARRSIASP